MGVFSRKSGRMLVLFDLRKKNTRGAFEKNSFQTQNDFGTMECEKYHQNQRLSLKTRIKRLTSPVSIELQLRNKNDVRNTTRNTKCNDIPFDSLRSPGQPRDQIDSIQEEKSRHIERILHEQQKIQLRETVSCRGGQNDCSASGG